MLSNYMSPCLHQAILQQAELGKLSLDEPAFRKVDAELQRQNKTTMLELWNGNQEVNRITIRDLLGMTSGLNDYDDNQVRMCGIVHWQ